MPDQTTDLIKQKIEIADFVKQYLELKPAGKNLKGLCPFHKEKTGSFMVSPERRIWHCFGCGKGGDIFGFLMQYENIEFVEALKVLADRAGVTLQQIGTADQKKYEVIYEINRIAKDYFKSGLSESSGTLALQYLKERGLSDITISEFELGVAPDGNDLLMRHLIKMGYHVDQILTAGLIAKNDRGMYYDFFRARIVFPLHNHFGKVIGFTGRIMPGNENPNVGKYVNSHESPIFNKSKLLFGFFKSKNFIREQGAAVLVEGQMDFLMAWQDGVKNLVATSGTALTADHLKLVRRIADNLVLSFDNDGAGRAAAERTIDLAQQNDFNTKIIIFDDPKLKDPADIVLAKPGQFAELITKAVPAMEYYFSYYGVNDSDIGARKKAIRQALAKIKIISSPVEQQHWLSELAVKSRIPESVLIAEMAGVKVDAQPGAPVVAPETPLEIGPATRSEMIVQRLLSLSIQDSVTADMVRGQLDIFPAAHKGVAEIILAGSEAKIPLEYAGIGNLIYLQSGFDSKPGEAEELLRHLKKIGLIERKKVLQQEIQGAEQDNDQGRLRRLLEEYKDLTHTQEGAG